MRITHQAGADEAYISLVPADVAVEHGRTVTLECVEDLGDLATSLVLDFDRDGHLTGIEVLAAGSLLREETLAQA